jgi:hypothetical protein
MTPAQHCLLFDLIIAGHVSCFSSGRTTSPILPEGFITAIIGAMSGDEGAKFQAAIGASVHLEIRGAVSLPLGQWRARA